MKLSSLPKTKQKLRLVLACAAAICILALSVSVIALFASKKNASAAAEDEAMLLSVPTPTSAPTPMAALTPSPTPMAEAVKVSLQISSSEEDLTVTVCGENGEPISGVLFSIKVKYPNGNVRTLTTDTAGTLHLDSLAQGEYTVTLSGNKGYTDSPEARCLVKEKLEYKPIENVSATTQVLTVSQTQIAETKPAQIASETLIIEDISTAQAVSQAAQQVGSENVITESSPAVTVEEPGKSYKYSYSVGTNGFLLYAGGGESDVQPVEENGVLSYGIRKAVNYYAPDGSPLSAPPEGGVCDVDYFMEESTEKVTLIFSPGSVDSTYAITAFEVSAGTAQSNNNIRVGWFEEDGKKYYYDSNGYPVTGLKRIDGTLHFFDGAGVKRGTLGLDVSYFNGPIDWNRVKRNGIEYVIVRVGGRTWGSGQLFEDENSYMQGASGGYYLQEAKSAGLKVGAYIYSNAINTNEAVEEASLAIEVLGKAGVALDFPVYLDLEYSGDYPSGRADRLTAAERGEIITAFCTTVQASGYSAGVYIGDNFLKTAIDSSVLTPYNVWYANYTNNYAVPKFTGYNIWQFTSSGIVSGMSGYADLNIMF